MTIALCILIVAIALLAFAQYVRAEQAIDDRDNAPVRSGAAQDDLPGDAMTARELTAHAITCVHPIWALAESHDGTPAEPRNVASSMAAGASRRGKWRVERRHISVTPWDAETITISVADATTAVWEALRADLATWAACRQYLALRRELVTLYGPYSTAHGGRPILDRVRFDAIEQECLPIRIAAEDAYGLAAADRLLVAPVEQLELFA